MQDVAIGIDLVKVSLVVDSLTCFGDRFLSRIFTAREVETCGRNHSDFVRRLAGRFAAKEATIKALRAANHGIGWKAIEIVNDDEGAPTLQLHDEARTVAHHARINKISVSLSHEVDYAVAVVLCHRDTSMTDMRRKFSRRDIIQRRTF